MLNPIPVTTDGTGPSGAIPIVLHGGGGGGGGSSTTDAITVEGLHPEADGPPLNALLEIILGAIDDNTNRIQAIEGTLDLDNG